MLSTFGAKTHWENKAFFRDEKESGDQYWGEGKEEEGEKECSRSVYSPSGTLPDS